MKTAKIRLGQGDPALTLKIYAQPTGDGDRAAAAVIDEHFAAVIDAPLRGRRVPDHAVVIRRAVCATWAGRQRDAHEVEPQPRTIERLLEGLADSVAATIVAPQRPPLRGTDVARQIAHTRSLLDGHGLGPGDRVAVVAADARQLAMAILGVASHATCLPLNHALTDAELERAFADLAPKALATPSDDQRRAEVVARRCGIEVVELPAVDDVRADAVAGGPARAAAPEDVALVLSTSGTTSRPKLVPLTQASLCISAANVASSLGLTVDDVGLVVMPLFHIHGLVAGLLAPLSVGGRIVCPPTFDPTQVGDWLREFRPTWYSAAPTVHQSMLDRVQRADDPEIVSSLRVVRSSSAPLSPRLARDLERVLDAPVIEAYGMTEAAHQIASNPLPPARRKQGTVGRAAGPEVAVVDGEIVIRGDNVTSGYVDNPAANRASFRDGWFPHG